jgi:hypothetical protein
LVGIEDGLGFDPGAKAFGGCDASDKDVLDGFKNLGQGFVQVTENQGIQ